jgi:hypothetical protein
MQPSSSRAGITTDSFVSVGNVGSDCGSLDIAQQQSDRSSTRDAAPHAGRSLQGCRLFSVMVSNPKPPLRGSHRAQPTASRKGAFPIARSPRDHRVVRVHLARTSALDFEGPVPLSTPSVEDFLLRTSVHRARICACGGPQEPFGLYTITEVNRVEPSMLLHRK